MPLILFTHPFASYCQKALIALYENDTPFTPRILDKSDLSTFAEFEALWPLKKFPLLLDGDQAIAEATIIIEYLDIYHPGPVRMISADPKSALEVRFADRFFDNYIHTPMQAIVADALREIGLPEGDIPMALLSFNVGIELGQLAFVFAILSGGVLLRRILVRLPEWAERVPVYAIGCLSAYWVLDRLSAWLR